MAQEISEHALIIVSDSGAFYLVKTKENEDNPAHHEPVSVEPLAPVFQPAAKFMRDAGVTMAYLPQHAFPGGMTCHLLNLQSLARARVPESKDFKKEK